MKDVTATKPEHTHTHTRARTLADYYLYKNKNKTFTDTKHTQKIVYAFSQLFLVGVHNLMKLHK